MEKQSESFVLAVSMRWAMLNCWGNRQKNKKVFSISVVGFSSSPYQICLASYRFLHWAHRLHIPKL
jgi:hypothetical protein